MPLVCSTSLTSNLSSKNTEQKLIIPLRITLGKIKYIIPGRNILYINFVINNEWSFMFLSYVFMKFKKIENLKKPQSTIFQNIQLLVWMFHRRYQIFSIFTESKAKKTWKNLNSWNCIYVRKKIGVSIF